MLLVFGAPCQLRLLAGQEHGRTIPLADIGSLANCRSDITQCHFQLFNSPPRPQSSRSRPGRKVRLSQHFQSLGSAPLSPRWMGIALNRNWYGLGIREYYIARIYFGKFSKSSFILLYSDLSSVFTCIAMDGYSAPRSVRLRLKPAQNCGFAVANAAADLNERRAVVSHSRLGKPGFAHAQKCCRLLCRHKRLRRRRRRGCVHPFVLSIRSTEHPPAEANELLRRSRIREQLVRHCSYGDVLRPTAPLRFQIGEVSVVLGGRLRPVLITPSHWPQVSRNEKARGQCQRAKHNTPRLLFPKYSKNSRASSRETAAW